MSAPVIYMPDSSAGRILLALRAGAMTSGELAARFPSGVFLGALIKAALVEACDNGWRLTAAGIAACPLRNPLAATVQKPMTRSARSSSPVGLPAKTAPQPHVHRPENLIHTGGIHVPNPLRTNQPSTVDQVRRLLIDAPDGLARKEIIRRTGLSDSTVDNAIFKLIKCGGAVRKSYGVIAPVQAGVAAIASHLAQHDMQSASAENAPTSSAAPAAQPPVVARHEPKGPDDESAATKIDFSIYDDGRLAISDGDELFVLPPDATRRLGQFLGRIEINGWPAHA